MVFGEGPVPAPLMLVGEAPGDEEDQLGRPFVGPSGALLSEMLAEVGIRRAEVYVTNAVKHFSYTERGKRRLHQKPTRTEVHACQGWLLAELDVVRPQQLVCLGATAAHALLGPDFRVSRQRGEVFHTAAVPWVMATYHPSALLRMPEEELRARAKALFRADLRKVTQARPLLSAVQEAPHA